MIPFKRRQPDVHYAVRDVRLYRCVRTGVPVANVAGRKRLRGGGAGARRYPRHPVGRRPVTAGALSGTAGGNGLQFHVPARRLHAPRRQHALPLDLRQQRRGFHGARALRDFLPAVRRGRGAGAGMAKPGLHHPHDRRQRRHFRRIGRLFTAVPARAGAGADSRSARSRASCTCRRCSCSASGSCCN